MSLIILVVSYVLAVLGQVQWPKEVSSIPQTKVIVSIRNEVGISGSFRMLHNDDYYFMFGKTWRGNLERVKLLARDCEIIQRDGETPRIEWHVVTFKTPNWVSFWPKETVVRTTKYDIIVPKDTVIEEFKLK